jgi:hypothetical protein
MKLQIIKYNDRARYVECERFEIRSNQVTNWICVFYKDGTSEYIYDFCVAKTIDQDEDAQEETNYDEATINKYEIMSKLDGLIGELNKQKLTNIDKLAVHGLIGFLTQALHQ